MDPPDSPRLRPKEVPYACRSLSRKEWTRPILTSFFFSIPDERLLPPILLFFVTTRGLHRYLSCLHHPRGGPVLPRSGSLSSRHRHGSSTVGVLKEKQCLSARSRKETETGLMAVDPQVVSGATEVHHRNTDVPSNVSTVGRVGEEVRLFGSRRVRRNPFQRRVCGSEFVSVSRRPDE